MYDFMKETVVMCAFMLIILMDIWGFGYLIVSLVKWVKKKIHKGEVLPEEEAKTETTE